MEVNRPLSVGGNAVELEDRTMGCSCMIIDFISAWRFSFVLSSSSEVLTSHLKGVYSGGYLPSRFGEVIIHRYSPTLRARLITQTAVGVVNELGTSMGPWYWLDWRSESSHCELPTCVGAVKFVRISSYLEQAISSGHIAKRSTKNIKLDRSLDAVWPRPSKQCFTSWLLSVFPPLLKSPPRLAEVRPWFPAKSTPGYPWRLVFVKGKTYRATPHEAMVWTRGAVAKPNLTVWWAHLASRSVRRQEIRLLWALFPFECWFVTADSNGRWV